MFKQQRPLTKVVQYQRRQHDRKPGQANRQFAEMPHVGIQRFHAGNRQHHRPQRHKRDGFIFEEEMNRPVRVQRLQHFRVSENTARAQYRQQQEPDQHNRREQLTHHAGTVLLNGK